MHNSGESIIIKTNDYEACIVTVGAGLCYLKYKQQDLVIAHDPTEIPLAHLGKILTPWPNRIANGNYIFDGKSYSLAINDRANNAAIHGLEAWVLWQIDSIYPNSCTLSTNVVPIYGYPFNILCQVTYTLSDEKGLEVSIYAKNIGKETAPYGCGSHPYLTCNNQPIEDLFFTLDSYKTYVVDENLNPKELVDSNNIGLDFSRRRQIQDTKIDHTFIPNKKHWEAILEGEKLSVTMSSDCPFIQIYSGEKLARKGIAIEPMSCAPDAFNSKLGLVKLKPNQSHILSFNISAKEKSLL